MKSGVGRLDTVYLGKVVGYAAQLYDTTAVRTWDSFAVYHSAHFCARML